MTMFNRFNSIPKPEAIPTPTPTPEAIVPETTKPNIGTDLNATTIIDTLLGETNKDISGVLSQPTKMPPQAPREPSNIFVLPKGSLRDRP